MPVTPAHAAAVVPFTRWKPYFWLSPLAIGSMAPDFIYYVFPPPEWRHIGHTLWGLVLFCIPAGLAVLYAFHQFFKRPLALLMPWRLRAKLWPHCEPFPLLPWRRLAWICMLIYLGAVTHVLWDGFTHEDEWPLREHRPVTGVMSTVAGYPLHWAGLLQFGSSLLGLGLLAWWSWRWYRRAPSGWAPADSEFLRRARPAIVAAIIIFGAGVGTFCGLAYASRFPFPVNVGEFLSATFITGVDAFLLALLVFVVCIRGGNRADRFRLLRDLSVRPKEHTEPGGDCLQETILAETGFTALRSDKLSSKCQSARTGI